MTRDELLAKLDEMAEDDAQNGGEYMPGMMRAYKRGAQAGIALGLQMAAEIALDEKESEKRWAQQYSEKDASSKNAIQAVGGWLSASEIEAYIRAKLTELTEGDGR